MQSSMTGTRVGLSAQREKVAADELAIVLSHFDIGVIESIQEYPKGSRKAPKILITSEQGKFLLKRRARGKDDAFKVACESAAGDVTEPRNLERVGKVPSKARRRGSQRSSAGGLLLDPGREIDVALGDG